MTLQPPLGTTRPLGSPGVTDGTDDPPIALSVHSGAGRVVLLTTVLGSALAGIDATVVGIALPTIGQTLEASFSGLQWTVTAYTLTLAAFILVGGGLGDRFGRRRVFVIGVVWFTASSVLCALAPNLPVLVGARALQGAGAAVLTPASLAIIETTFAVGEHSRAIGVWAGASGMAAALAPFLGEHCWPWRAGAGSSWSTCPWPRSSSCWQLASPKPSTRAPGAEVTCAAPCSRSCASGP